MTDSVSPIFVERRRRGHPVRRRLPRARVTNTARRDDDQDLKLFALSFTAFFICIYTLIC
ncbi:MAG: hypothetical protein WC803_04545 [Sphingomonas sp.]